MNFYNFEESSAMRKGEKVRKFFGVWFLFFLKVTYLEKRNKYSFRFIYCLEMGLEHKHIWAETLMESVKVIKLSLRGLSWDKQRQGLWILLTPLEKMGKCVKTAQETRQGQEAEALKIILGSRYGWGTDHSHNPAVNDVCSFPWRLIEKWLLKNPAISGSL